MAPSDEALTWQRRADDWAQQAEVEPYNGGGGQEIEPANRWSSAEVSTTGRPTFPADGVGWRTETAEWRATGARWRQTTEWRSSTGSHVWRSTTEAWQDEEDGAPRREQEAISGTAWPTPGTDSDGDSASTPSWRQSAADQTPSWRQSRADPGPSWQQPRSDSTPSWQEPRSESTPSWQESRSESTPSWQQSRSDPAPSWQQSARSEPAPSWQQPRSEPTPSWQQPRSEPTPSWQQPRSEPTPSWQQSPAPAAEPAPSWRQSSDPAPSWRQTEPETPSWQRTDPEASGSRRRRPDGPAATTPVEQTWSSGSSSWQQPSASTPSWQQTSARTPAWQQPQQTPSWQQPSGPAPARRRDEDQTGAARSGRADRPEPGENTGGITRWERTDAPGWQRSAADDARHLVREDDRAAWRRDSERPTRVGRRRAAESGAAPSGGTGWTSGSDGDNWAGHTDTGSIPAFIEPDDGPAAPSWGTRSGGPSRRDRRRAAEQERPELTRPDSGRAGQSRTDIGRPDQSRTDIGWPDQSRTDIGRPDQSRTDIERPGLSRIDVGRRGGAAPKRGKPRYNANPTNWREDTSSWDADQDTSNWTRDPDTGQWSRAEDDPRVLAWRAEAARREAAKGEPEPEPEEEPTGRRARRADPSGGVPGGPLPSSAIPSGGGPGWAAGAVPNEAPSGGMPRNALPGPADEDQGRRRRGADPDRTGGRRRASDSWQQDSGPQRPADAWQSQPDPRQSRQYRRIEIEPEDYSTPDDGRPGPRPPQWQDPGPDPRRSGYRDEPPDQSGYGQSYPPPQQPPRRSGFGSAARELPAGPSAQQQRPGYGGPARELPAGPSAQQPSRAPRELPAGPSAYAAGDPGQWSDRERPQQPPTRPVSGPAWPAQERQQPEPQRPGYGASGTDSWLDQEGRQQRPGGGSSWIEQERRQQAPQRPAGGEPSWLDQERQQQSPTAPVSGPSWLEQERQRQRPQSGPSYGGPRIPTQSPGYDARELPAGSSAPSWSEQRKPAYGGSEDLTARWPDPLAEQSGRGGYDNRDEPPSPDGGGFGGRPPLTDWLAAERAERRGTTGYRTGAGQDGETDWRRELSGDPAEGESRRYSTSDFPPFRPSGSASVDGTSNLALSSTSVISTEPGAAARAGGGTALAVEEDTSWPPRRSTGAFQGTGSYERRPVSDDYFTTGVKQNDLLDPDDDEEEEDNGSPLAAVGYTVVWYGVPVVLFVAGMLVLNTGGNNTALDTLAGALPQFGISLVLSMLVAYGLRTATTSWKSASVGLAAAVVGGGLATVLSSAITGNSLS
ncbi:hypothetical protein [Actinoplanes sp. G11-F43]|uniref:hypothetical protein n=1 Tax=Actinoplanes sp. G11-F43 TaxID=3424130 RepID=UPI003D3535EE